MKLQDAADYIKYSKASVAFLHILYSIKRIFNFTQERSNRVVRYIKIVKAYTKGEPVNKIAEKYGCDKSTILRYARLAGIPKRPKHLPEEIKAAVIKDYKNKIPVKTIAKLNGVSQGYVSTVARKAGLKRY